MNTKFPILGFFTIARATTTGIANEFPNPALIAVTVRNPSRVPHHRTTAIPHANPHITCAHAATGSTHISVNADAVTLRARDVHNSAGRKNDPLNRESALATRASSHPRRDATAPSDATAKISSTARIAAKNI